MQYAPDVIPVCELCSSLPEILTNEKQCEKCGISYCLHFSSDLDVRFCGNCMVDFTVETSTEIRTIESTANSGVIYKRRDICTRLKLQGTDYLFAASKISLLNDEELDATIEYHRAIADAMLREREARRVEKYAGLQKTIVRMQHDANRDSTGALKGSAKTPKERAEDELFKKEKKQSEKKDKRVSTKTVNSGTAADALAFLMKAGLDPNALANLLGGKK